MNFSIITYFPIGNGGMKLLRLNDRNETTILKDINIRDPSASEEDICDVSQELRDRLPKDSKDRPYVDAFILTHHHDDHLRGLQEHFHLGVIDDYTEPKDDEQAKIIIRELWSTPKFWKQVSENYPLSDDAKAFNKEMKRRVKLFQKNKTIQDEGNRAIILGKDVDGKTEGLEEIVRDIDCFFSKVNERDITSKLEIFLLGPLEQQQNEPDEDFDKKNRQSIVMQMNIKEGSYSNLILMCADAECLVWDTLWDKYRYTERLKYNLLSIPHHCSWHSLSYDSQSECDDPKVCRNAKLALSQAKSGASLIAQSKPIKNDDDDPPSKAAKDEYLTITERFFCIDEQPKEGKAEPLEFNLTGGGPQQKGIKEKSKLAVAALASTKESYPHG
jgi:hypothetical protein